MRKRVQVYTLAAAMLMAGAAGCSDGEVTFDIPDGSETDAGDTGGGGSDVGGEDVTDTGGADTAPDVAPDIVEDTGPDVVEDTGPDAVEDTGSDVVEDTGSDAADTGADVVEDTTEDTGGDVTEDTGDDVTEDTGGEDVVVSPLCGNGEIDDGEECDDGNDINDDECSNACLIATCGDGITNRTLGEETFDSPIVTDPFRAEGYVCDDGGSCPGGTCDVTDDPWAPEHGICQALGFDFALEVTWEGGPGSGAGVLHADHWDCIEYSCIGNEARSTGPCEEWEMLTSITCEGIVGEECDDGADNADEADACRRDCTLPFCGDGIVDSDEECDDANGVDDDGCSNTCLLPQCGDGVLNGEEECDDGNDVNTDSCRNDCLLPSCGDGIVSDFEADEVLSSPIVTNPFGVTGHVCDDGGTCQGRSCDVSSLPTAPEHGICEALGFDQALNVAWGGGAGDSDPTMPHAYNWACVDYDCGPGPNSYSSDNCSSGEMLNTIRCFGGTTEACDEGEDNSDAADATCRTDCTVQRCGDGIVDTGEDCDDGNDDDTDTCTSLCTSPFCGDGIIQPALGEECDTGDDRSDEDADACRTDCLEAYCSDGVLDTGEECDDGNLIDDDGCNSLCELPGCGDGVVQPELGEECDDGNDSNSDECTNRCEFGTCGDGYVQRVLGEDCDDGNDIDDDLCTNLCLYGPDYVPYNVYLMPYDFYEWDAAGAALLRRMTEFEFVATPRIGMVSECTDTSGSTSGGSPGGSSPGEFNATIAALRFAGVDEANIQTLANAAAAEAAFDTWDVIIFPEFERCSPSTAEWGPVLRLALESGKRMIVMFPSGNATRFVGGLGFLGTGSSGSSSTPYRTAESAFWEGITMPGRLNATSGWNWSAADQEVLASDASGTPMVLRINPSLE